VKQGGAREGRRQMKKMKIEFTLGKSDIEPRVDGVRFACASEKVADQIRAAYEKSEPEFERIVNRLCDAGKAEYLGI
jgi:hypothetical protein